jgi:general secretion pathway protein L
MPAWVGAKKRFMPSILDWWINQLLSLLPRRWLEISQRRSDAVILELERDVMRVILRTGGTRTHACSLPANGTGIEDLTRFLKSKKDCPRSIRLRLPPSQLLHKRVTLPTAVLRNLEQVLGFEIDRETPFSPDEVHWTYSARPARTGNARLDVDLYLVPRASVAQVLAALERAGVTLHGIEAAGGEGQCVLVRCNEKKRGHWLRVERSLMPFAATAAALAVVLIMTPLLVKQYVLMSADAVMTSLAGPAREAATLRQTLDSATRGVDLLKEERKRNTSVVSVLAAVTEALPDDTYLTSLSIRGGKLTMSGLSSSAASLIGVLAKTPWFAGPAFDAPVVQNEQNDRESFTLSVTLAPAGTR